MNKHGWDKLTGAIMTDTQLHILKTAMDWAKAEIFSSMFFALFGVAFLFASASFWYLGKTETAKAFVIPLLVTGILLVILGVGLVIANQWRLSTFPTAFAADAKAFLASEITRADKTVSGYQKAVQIYLPAIIAICALALLVVKTPNWRASMIAIIAIMRVIMLVDTNASMRMEDYQKTLEEFHTS